MFVVLFRCFFCLPCVVVFMCCCLLFGVCGVLLLIDCVVCCFCVFVVCCLLSIVCWFVCG